MGCSPWTQRVGHDWATNTFKATQSPSSSSGLDSPVGLNHWLTSVLLYVKMTSEQMTSLITVNSFQAIMLSSVWGPPH